MTMQTYWGVPASERHLLTDEQLEKFVRIQRAEDGVVIPPEPEQVAVPPVEGLARAQLWKVEVKELDRYAWSVNSMTFTTEQAARDAAQTTVLVREKSGVDHIAGHTVEVTQVSAATAGSFAEHAAQLEQAATAKTVYDNEVKLYNEALEKAQKSAEGIWSDYRDHCAADVERGRIRAAHAEHLELAEGDEEVARRFTVKAYGEEEVAEALGEVTT